LDINGNTGIILFAPGTGEFIDGNKKTGGDVGISKRDAFAFVKQGRQDINLNTRFVFDAVYKIDVKMMLLLHC
jgi:hypothetical protein